MSAVDFLRIGRTFRVGDMLRQGHIKGRMDGNGISLTEFCYQVLQSYDWLVLSKKYDCFFQASVLISVLHVSARGIRPIGQL